MCIYSILTEQEITSKTFLTKLSENTRPRMWVWDHKIGCLISNCNPFYLCEHRITNDSLKCQCLHIQKKKKEPILWQMSQDCCEQWVKDTCESFVTMPVAASVMQKLGTDWHFSVPLHLMEGKTLKLHLLASGRLLGKYMGAFATEVAGQSASMG